MAPGDQWRQEDESRVRSMAETIDGVV